MKPVVRNGHISAHCPDCQGAYSSFEQKAALHIPQNHKYQDVAYGHIHYVLGQCTGCRRGGLAKIHDTGDINTGAIEFFFPYSIDTASIPPDVPRDIVSEFREAELCASFGAHRAASAMFRSTLEKTLKANGYTKGTLQSKIDEAAKDGVITEPRRKRAHDEIRVLGNDVLHDEWREVAPDEVDAAHLYTQRILEDFYDHRSEVEKILMAKKRIPAPTP